MNNWKERLEKCYRSVSELKDRFSFSDEEVSRLMEIEEKYPVCIPEYYLDLIDVDDRRDPIRKMCIPDAMEFSSGGEKDTSGEADNTVVQGMQHKYSQTALILSTNQCAMYCRHCFRKRLVGLSSEEIASHLPEMRDYVSSHTEINNVLISGGDAFLNSNEVIERYLKTFMPIENIEFIRFGTRTPVSFPYRITEDEELLGILERYGRDKSIIIVTQFNHPKEISEEAVKAVKLLLSAGCMVRNQTVLLKGVNDSSDVLSTLMNKLVSTGVMPYYIFQCRPVEGVKNQFQVPLVKGVSTVDEGKNRMSGPAKAIRYVMSHPRGKIEILGRVGDELLFKFHQAKYKEDEARIFTRPVVMDECWF